MAARPQGGTSERVLRHKLADRIYHWIIASTVLTLLGTSFLPILGIKFEWLMIHWIAGFVLIFAVLYHIVRATIWLSLKSMLVGPSDAVATWRAANWMMRRPGATPVKPGKYPLAQKLYHHGIAVMIVATAVSGFFMIRKITIPVSVHNWWKGVVLWAAETADFDPPIWIMNYFKRDPYWLSADTWGWIYIAHGAAALFVLSLVMVHIYFAVRPDKFWITRSMFVGWIAGRDYREKFDPSRWAPEAKRETAGSTQTAAAE